MRSEAPPKQQMFIAAAAPGPDLGRGGASYAFDVVSQRRIEGMDLAQIKAQLYGEGYSEFAVQLFEPSIARLIKRGLPPLDRKTAASQRRQDWRPRIGAVRRWLSGQGLPPTVNETIEEQLHRQLEAMRAFRRL